jgi:hypothetical protein
VLFHVVGMYGTSADVARIVMIVTTGPSSAIADHVKAAEWASSNYMKGS